MEAFALAQRDAYGLLPLGDHGTYSLLPAYMEKLRGMLHFSSVGRGSAGADCNQALAASLQVRKTRVSSKLSGNHPRRQYARSV
jgi:hypothetical protein